MTAPAELPVEMNAFKSQQHRWAKGSIQTGRKLLRDLWRSRLSGAAKLEATFHLTANAGYPLMLLLCLLMYPALRARADLAQTWLAAAFDTSIFALATVSVLSFYAAAQMAVDREWRRSLKYLPAVISVGIGLAVNNAGAVLEALLGRQSPFVRTPKYRSMSGQGVVFRYRPDSTPLWALEVFFGCYLLWTLRLAWLLQHWLLCAFLVLFCAGFLYVGLSSLRDALPGGARALRLPAGPLPP